MQLVLKMDLQSLLNQYRQNLKQFKGGEIWYKIRIAFTKTWPLFNIEIFRIRILHFLIRYRMLEKFFGY